MRRPSVKLLAEARNARRVGFDHGKWLRYNGDTPLDLPAWAPLPGFYNNPRNRFVWDTFEAAVWRGMLGYDTPAGGELVK